MNGLIFKDPEMMKLLNFFVDDERKSVSKNAEKIQKLFKKINKELNVTIVLVTHNKAFSKIADKCLVLSDGKWSK